MEDKIDDIIDTIVTTKYIITFVEFLELEEKAREKTETKEGLNKYELLLLYVCYLIQKAFCKYDINEEIDNNPSDVALINSVYVKMLGYDPTYEDRNSWLKGAIKIILEIYNLFISTEDYEKLFANSFSMLDNIVYNLITKSIEAKHHPWNYIVEYDKNMVSIEFIRYINTYWDTIDKIYSNNKEDEIDDDDL